MKKYFFSKTTCSFYPAELLEDYKSAGTLPDDAIPVTDAAYETYTGIPPDGKIRGASNRGQPAWVDIPESTKEDSVLLATMKKQRLMADAEEIITPLARAVKLGMATEDEAAVLLAWERYTVLLSRIDPQQGRSIEWPELPA
ncbi:tail fiber assembly protein [Serratia marcescens]|uniref:tail fiber assembly protein n=1 Tax=Serratia marcescens TaxID=615 RepID=UPI003EDAE60A